MALQRIDTAFGPNPIRFNGNIQPQANANVFLGNTGYQFSTIYASTFSGTATHANLSYFLGSGTAINPSSANVAGNIVGYATTVSGNVSTGAIVSRGGLGVAGVGMFGGNLVATSGTASSDTTTGALVVIGGAGITGRVSAANLYVSNGVYWSGNNAAFSSAPGGSQGQLQFNDSSVFAGANIIFDNSTGNLVITSTTTSSSATTGALVVLGGVGVGNNLNVNGIIESFSNTQATSTSTGALQLTGGASISTGNLYIGGSDGTAIVATGNIVPSGNVASTNNIGSDTAWWNNFYGVATQARYADLAENYQADFAYEPGTVLEFGGSDELTLAQDGSRRVAGVVSTNPAHLMNGMLQGANVVPLALQGRTPCKVRGRIQKGDMLVSAGSGFARPDHNPQIGTVIGKALENFDGIEGVIEVVVGRM